MATKPHVLAIPFPAQGHMSSMLHLCKKIAAEGFTVTYLNMDSIDNQMKKHWVPPQGLDIRLDSMPFSWSIPCGFDAHCMANLVSFFTSVESLGPALQQTIERLSTQVAPVVCIISDYFLPIVHKVADKLGIPRVVLSTGNATWIAVEFHIEELMTRGIVPVKGCHRASQELITDLAALSPLRAVDLPIYLQIDDPRWMEIAVDRVNTAKNAQLMLANSFYDMEKEAFDFVQDEMHGGKFVPIGPIFVLDHGEKGPENVVLRKEDRKCLSWLDTQSPGSVLYITFGSIAVLSEEQFKELVLALESLKQPFLWVVRSELIISKGEKAEGYDELLERVSTHGYIVSWAPQLQVLAHEAVGGHLTHCGWNSILESLCNGVPLLGWPWAAEQHLNRKYVVQDWKVGSTFRVGDGGLVEKEEIERQIKLLMHSEQGKMMKKNASKYMKLGKDAVAKGGVSHQNLSRFLKELRSVPSSNGHQSVTCA